VFGFWWERREREKRSGCLPRKGARQLDCYFQNPETCIRTNRKKRDTLTECTLFYMKKIQAIEQVSVV
jgi:hypothetical protein